MCKPTFSVCNETAAFAREIGFVLIKWMHWWLMWAPHVLFICVDRIKNAAVWCAGRVWVTCIVRRMTKSNIHACQSNREHNGHRRKYYTDYCPGCQTTGWKLYSLFVLINSDIDAMFEHVVVNVALTLTYCEVNRCTPSRGTLVEEHPVMINSNIYATCSSQVDSEGTEPHHGLIKQNTQNPKSLFHKAEKPIYCLHSTLAKKHYRLAHRLNRYPSNLRHWRTFLGCISRHQVDTICGENHGPKVSFAFNISALTTVALWII